MDSPWYLKTFRGIKRVAIVCVNFPHYRREKLLLYKYAKESQAPSRELKEYLEIFGNERHIRKLTIFLVVMHLAYCFKKYIGLFYMLSLYDHNNLEDNIHESDGGHNMVRFSCISTNCSRILPDSSLAQDLSRFPLFSFCYPKLCSIYSPAKFLDSYGYIMFSLTGYGVFLFAAVLPLKAILYPQNNEPVMFIVAPTITREITKQRIRKYITDMATSYANFRSIQLRIRLNRHSNNYKHLDKRLIGASKTSLSMGRPGYQLSSNLKTSPFTKQLVCYGRQDLEEALCSSYFKGGFDINNFVEDCLPAIRSTWWQRRAARAHSLLYGSVVVAYSFAAVFILQFTQKKIDEKEDLLLEFHHHMNRNNCSVWLTDKGPSETLDLRLVNVRWVALSALETLCVLIVPVTNVVTLIGYFFISYWDITCFYWEIRMQMLTAIELVRFQAYTKNQKHLDLNVSRPLSSDSGDPVMESDSVHFRLNDLRSKFMANTQCKSFTFKYNLLCRKNPSNNPKQSGCSSELDKKIAYQEFVIDMMMADHHFNNCHIELLEKIYINLRLFIGLVQHCGSLVAGFIILIYAMVYGHAFEALWYSKNITNFAVAPMMVPIVFVLLTANLLIYLGSYFHANAKKLHPLLWTLIAQTTNDLEDLKILHIRTLLTKQLTVLDHEGGLAVNAFNVRITYVNIFQLIIFTATVLVLAFQE